MAPCAPYPQGWGFRERCISFFLFLLFIYLFFRESYFFLFFFFGEVYFYHPSPHIPALTSHSLSLPSSLLAWGLGPLAWLVVGCQLQSRWAICHTWTSTGTAWGLSSAIRQMQSATFDRQRVSHSKPQRNGRVQSATASSPKARCFLLHSEDTLTVFSINNLKDSRDESATG